MTLQRAAALWQKQICQFNAVERLLIFSIIAAGCIRLGSTHPTRKLARPDHLLEIISGKKDYSGLGERFRRPPATQ